MNKESKRKFNKSVDHKIELKKADLKRNQDEVEVAQELLNIAENETEEQHLQSRIDRFKNEIKKCEKRIKELEKAKK